MEDHKKKILQKLADAVVEMDESEAGKLATKAIQSGISPIEAIQNGLAVGMEIVGQKYETEEYFIPQLLLCSDAMYAGLNILKPALCYEDTHLLGKIIIGVVEGDTHDIGKSLVQMMLEASGFGVIDLGKNVPIDHFIASAEEHQADMICLSTLMSTTMDGMAVLIEKLKANGLRDKYPVVIGGGPVSHKFCKKIGADGYSPDAAKAVRLIKSILQTP